MLVVGGVYAGWPFLLWDAQASHDIGSCLPPESIVRFPGR